MSLDDLRQQIDKLDKEIVDCLNQRARIASEVGRIKSDKGEPFYVPSREEEVFQKLEAVNQGPLDGRALRAIYREIISASIALEKKLEIAYLGPEATYTQQAAIKNFGSSVNYKALSSIADVFSTVEKGESDYGVIPIENSNEGGVIHSMDMLIESELKIVAQVYLPIEHCLMSRSELSKIKVVYSKDQALGQCRDWLRRNIPQAQLVDTPSTTIAVKRAAGEQQAAAIAGSLASELYQVPIVASGIQDRADNSTRFLIVGREPASLKGNCEIKTSIVISVSDKPGALQGALEPFSSRNINMTKIESRPSRRKAWDYVFFIDFIGHWESPEIQDAIAELVERCPLVKWLGSYPNTPREG